MIQLLVIADDFTGALDTGVQLSSWGIGTKVIVRSAFGRISTGQSVQALVVDAETRHLSPERAFEIVESIARRALEMDIRTIYKKTDSALRGNIGAELTAVLSASGERQLSFVPAFPKMNRWTKNGVHFIDHIPVHEGVFGKDPFEPVLCSKVSDIIAQSSDVPVFNVELGCSAPDAYGIAVYDAVTDDDLRQIAGRLLPPRRVRILAGCAGFAAFLPYIIGLQPGRMDELEPCESILIACGSVNPVSAAQCTYAERQGVARIKLRADQILYPDWASTPEADFLARDILERCQREGLVMIDTSCADTRTEEHMAASEVRITIQQNLSSFLKKLYDDGLQSTVFIMGGDSLMGLMSALGVSSIEPVREVEVGVVLSRFTYRRKEFALFSKSGGFGSPTLFIDLMERFCMMKGKEMIC